MAILYVVNRPPGGGGVWASYLRMLVAGDGLLLIENGVYGAARGVLSAEQWPILSQVERFVLLSDLEKRGLSVDLCESAFRPVDYAEFVNLVARFDSSISWG